MTTTITPPEPCGYCRRCAVHDDPGGCLEVERWEREHPDEAIAAAAQTEWAQTHPLAFLGWAENLREEAAGFQRGVEARERYDDAMAAQRLGVDPAERTATLARLHQQMCNAMADPEHPNVRATHAQLDAAQMDAFDRAEAEEAADPSFDTRLPALAAMTTAELEAGVRRFTQD